jgi:hypothetical protein
MNQVELREEDRSPPCHVLARAFQQGSEELLNQVELGEDAIMESKR